MALILRHKSTVKVRYTFLQVLLLLALLLFFALPNRREASFTPHTARIPRHIAITGLKNYNKVETRFY